VSGREGAGKTTLATQIALFLDEDFSLRHTVFTPEQFEAVIESCPEESAILWDEAVTGAQSTQSATTISIAIVSRLTQIRKKKLKIILCHPYFWLLNKYFISRCIGGFYVYANGFDDRGYGYAYNTDQIEYLFSLMKEKYRLAPRSAINIAHKSFRFRFPGKFCLNEKEYDTKKELARKGDIRQDEKMVMVKRLAKHCKYLGATNKEIGELVNRTERTISRWFEDRQTPTYI